ncbi:ProQ/FinO family protein [Trinickia sp. LjRoot230]|uniref:ProQ/FinO family protein n=1 Tax=Trinickia sp. LjRoot230 TaxID=3342288 RepID=UPI003ECDB223
MGFEQLAELKKQLAKEARAAKEAKEAKQAKEANPAKRPAPSAGPQTAKPARRAPSAQAKPNGRAAVKSDPVDPVVRVIGKLQKRFPVAFPKNPAPKLPLKIGIFADLVAFAGELGLSEAEIREAVSTWCRGSRYWACLTEGAARVDLNGAPAGEVSARDAAFARRQAKGGGPRHKRSGAPVAANAPANDAPANDAPAPDASSLDGTATTGDDAANTR